MKQEAGVWIDHRHAIIVTLENGQDAIQHIEADVEKRVRYSGASHAQSPSEEDDLAEDIRDRRIDNHLNQYYDEVIAALPPTGSVIIMGPGEAKGELRKRIEEKKSNLREITTVPADKLSDAQIAAQVKHYFEI